MILQNGLDLGAFVFIFLGEQKKLKKPCGMKKLYLYLRLGPVTLPISPISLNKLHLKWWPFRKPDVTLRRFDPLAVDILLLM